MWIEECVGFTCKADNSCIPYDLQCNDEFDCLDGSDEENCGKCTIADFTCDDGSCVPELARCNGTMECSDGSDERDCSK